MLDGSMVSRDQSTEVEVRHQQSSDPEPQVDPGTQRHLNRRPQLPGGDAPGLLTGGAYGAEYRQQSRPVGTAHHLNQQHRYDCEGTGQCAGDGKDVLQQQQGRMSRHRDQAVDRGQYLGIGFQFPQPGCDGRGIDPGPGDHQQDRQEARTRPSLVGPGQRLVADLACPW